MAKHAKRPTKARARRAQRPVHTDQRPRLGSGVEPLENEGLGYGRREVPESQGRFAGEGFGQAAQGDYGDEDFDPSYARGEDVEPPSNVEERPLRGLPAEHEGVGRGQEGTPFATQEPTTTEPVTEATGAPAGSDTSLARPDASIEEEIEERLAEELELDSVDVAATVADGVVTLEGIVDRTEMRDAAERCASEVAGVRAIENRIRLRGGADQE